MKKSADIIYKRKYKALRYRRATVCIHILLQIQSSRKKGMITMEIAKVAEQAAVTPQTAPKSSVQTASEKAKNTLTADNADKYVKSEEIFTPAYTKKSAQKKDVDNATNEFKGSVAQTKAEHLASVVDTIISHQASKISGTSKSKIELSGELKAQIEEVTGKKVESEETESENYWGAEATAKRIFEFAKTLSGDNKEFADTLKDAFIKGFGLAEKAYGGKGKFPSVCYETYDKVIEMFDDWTSEKSESEESGDTVKVEASDKSEQSAQ